MSNEPKTPTPQKGPIQLAPRASGKTLKQEIIEELVPQFDAAAQTYAQGIEQRVREAVAQALPGMVIGAIQQLLADYAIGMVQQSLLRHEEVTTAPGVEVKSE